MLPGITNPSMREVQQCFNIVVSVRGVLIGAINFDSVINR